MSTNLACKRRIGLLFFHFSSFSENNSDLGRITEPGERDYRCLEKYRRAIAKLVGEV